MEKGIFDIQLMDRPVARRGKVKDGADRRRLDDRGEHLMEVHPRSLREAAYDPPCFAPFERSVGVQLVLEQPLAGDDVGMLWSRNERPRAVCLESVIFSLHGRTPVGVVESCTDRRRWRCRRSRSGDVGVPRVGHVDAIPCSSDHVMSRRHGGCRRRGH